MLTTLPPTGRYGAASFCRTGSYGMPQFVTNTMRLCTKDAANASYDASVPVRPIYRKEGSPGASATTTTTPSFGGPESEHCSESPYDVPWTLDDPAKASNPAAMFSVGSVPMWDGNSVSGR
jgi:hypothetical protein